MEDFLEIQNIILEYKRKTYPYDGENWYYNYIKDSFPKCDEVCIYPLGNSAINLYSQLKDKLNVCYMSDGNEKKIEEYKRKNAISGVKILDEDSLYKKKNHILIIVSSVYHGEICHELQEKGFPYVYRILERQLEFQNKLKKMEILGIEKNLRQVYELVGDEMSRKVIKTIAKFLFLYEDNTNYWDSVYDKKQYFPQDIIKLTDKEVFCDVGAYDGDSFKLFLNEMQSIQEEFCGAHLFELSKKNYDILKSNISHYSKTIQDKVKCWNIGLSDKEKQIKYLDLDEQSTTRIINTVNTQHGKIIPLDTIRKQIQPTYIKMDIEGEEYAALNGAKTTIYEYEPKLGICTYHNIEDIWRIPQFINSCNKKYEIFFRHHSQSAIETVCYAVIK